MAKASFLICVIVIAASIPSSVSAQRSDSSTCKRLCKMHYRDIYPDTWVGEDALGRQLPTYKRVGPPRPKKYVGIFYITWHTNDRFKLPAPYRADVSKILVADPNARLNGRDSAWGPYDTYHWAEPWDGYFLSKDPYVIRYDISMLSDAGVDFLVMDATNGVCYWRQWEAVFKVMEQMKAEGDKVPKFCFWAFNGPVITVVQNLYERIYRPGLYKDLWFYWNGKPLLLYNGSPKVDTIGEGGRNPYYLNPNPDYDPGASTDRSNPHYGNPDYMLPYLKNYTKAVRTFFTLRTMWWGYYKWKGRRFVGTENNWSFGYELGDSRVRAMTPDQLVSKHNGEREEFAVTPAQHASTMIGKSWTKKDGEPALDRYDLPDYGYVPWLHKWVKNPEDYGIYFQERWDEALKADPEIICINDWNEWTANKFNLPHHKSTTFMGRKSNYFFVDQYNAEFNRDIDPMKGGYSDNYYMQMVENIRRFKGVHPIPIEKGFSHIKMGTSYACWQEVMPEFRDTRGDTEHRDYDGYGGLHYIDTLGRNDIITSKVAVDRHNVYFFAETAQPLTPSSDRNWMLLFINSDRNYKSGWYGYDFLIDKPIVNDTTTTLMRFDSLTKKWVEVAHLSYRYSGDKLVIKVPRKSLGLSGKNSFRFDFKWCDNPSELNNPISLCTAGDTAPDWRFNYRFIWEK